MDNGQHQPERPLPEGKTEGDEEKVLEFELANLAVPVAPVPHKISKEHNAYRIAVVLMIGIGSLLLLNLAMLARVTWGPEPADKMVVDTWLGTFTQVKELSIFVLGALLGHWYKGDAV